MKKTYKMSGVDCANCAAKMEKYKEFTEALGK